MARRSRKVYPQLVALEVVLVIALGLAGYWISEQSTRYRGAAQIITAIAVATLLRIVLRHRNKRLLPKFRRPQMPYKIVRTTKNRRR